MGMRGFLCTFGGQWWRRVYRCWIGNVPWWQQNGTLFHAVFIMRLFIQVVINWNYTCEYCFLFPFVKIFHLLLLFYAVVWEENCNLTYPPVLLTDLHVRCLNIGVHLKHKTYGTSASSSRLHTSTASNCPQLKGEHSGARGHEAMGITAPELRENSSGTAALFVPCFLALTRFRGCRMTVSVKNVGAFILSDTYMPDCQDHHLQNVIRISPVIKKQEMIGFGALMCLVVGECKQKRNKFVLMGKLPTALEQMKAPERWLNVSASSQINHRGRRHDPVFIRHECKKKKGGGEGTWPAHVLLCLFTNSEVQWKER